MYLVSNVRFFEWKFHDTSILYTLRGAKDLVSKLKTHSIMTWHGHLRFFEATRMIRKLTTLRSVPLLSPLDQLQCEGPGVFLGATFAGKRCQFTAVRYLRICSGREWLVCFCCHTPSVYHKNEWYGETITEPASDPVWRFEPNQNRSRWVTVQQPNDKNNEQNRRNFAGNPYCFVFN